MENAMIYEQMVLAMSEIGAITKSKRNQQQGFQYRGIDDVMNALYPVLSKFGLFLVPEVLEQTREERTNSKGTRLIYSILKMRYTLYAHDGSSVSAVVIGEGMDSGDKASNKAMAVAMKYAMFQMFCIPTEEMAAADPDRYSPDLIKDEMDVSAPKCADCGGEIKAVEVNCNGETQKLSGADVIAKSKMKFGRCLCWDCCCKAKKAG